MARLPGCSRPRWRARSSPNRRIEAEVELGPGVERPLEPLPPTLWTVPLPQAAVSRQPTIAVKAMERFATDSVWKMPSERAGHGGHFQWEISSSLTAPATLTFAHGLAHQEAPQADAQEEAQEDAEGHPLAAAGGQVAH